MKTQNKILTIMALALVALGARAQESEAVLEDQPVSPPPLLNGQGPSPAFQSETVRTNYLLGGLSFTGASTDNVLLSSTHPESDFSYQVQPYISFSETTARTNWDVSLAAGLIAHQRLTTENQFAKSVVLDFTYRLSPKLSLKLSDAFMDTNALFSTSNLGTSGSSTGVVEQSNNTLLVPYSQRTVTNASLAELSYELSPSSSVGLRGGFSILEYPGSSPNAEFGSLYDTQTYLAEVFYNRHVSSSQWVGVTLRTQRFDTSIANTETDSLLLYYSLKISPNINLSFFAGPEYYDTRVSSDNVAPTGLFQGHQWTSAEGATVSWQSERTSVAATYSRQLSDGGGLYQAVILESASASLRHQWGRGLELKLAFTYAANDPLLSSPVESGYNLHGVSGLCELQERFNRNFLLRVGYARQRQEWPGSQGAATANLSWVSVSYSFSHLLGTGSSTKPAGRLPL
jgi:hypothetical protein